MTHAYGYVIQYTTLSKSNKIQIHDRCFGIVYDKFLSEYKI